MKDHIIKPMVLGIIDYLKKEPDNPDIDDTNMEMFCKSVIDESIKATNMNTSLYNNLYRALYTTFAIFSLCCLLLVISTIIYNPKL